MSIGNVNSNERGSGARYNDGKIKMEYMPMRVLMACMHEDLAEDVTAIVDALIEFEEQGHHMESLAEALDVIGFRDTCEVFHYGAKKYAAWNWAKGMPWSVPMACIKRHLLAISCGEEIDPESGLPHIGHVGCNVVMLMHYLVHYPEGDDLPPPECFGVEVIEHPDECVECIELVAADLPLSGEITLGNHEQWLRPGDAPVGEYKPLTADDYRRMREAL